MTCSKCKKEIGNRLVYDGLPNGVGFELEDGTLINICTDCLLEEQDGEDLDKLLKDIMENEI